MSVALERVDVAENVRELDPAHVDSLAASIALRGLIVPLTVRPVGERFQLVAGHHRLAACRKLGLDEIPVTIREQDATSADAAAGNILRRQLTPLETGAMASDATFVGWVMAEAAGVGASHARLDVRLG